MGPRVSDGRCRPPSEPRGPRCSLSTGNRALGDHPRLVGRRSHSEADGLEASQQHAGRAGLERARLDPRPCSIRDVRATRCRCTEREEIGEIESQIRDFGGMCWCGCCDGHRDRDRDPETCDVETGVRRDRAIDGRLGVQGSARVEVECAGRRPGDGLVEVWPLARSRPEPLRHVAIRIGPEGRRLGVIASYPLARST
jgi:hypothetical protein